MTNTFALTITPEPGTSDPELLTDREAFEQTRAERDALPTHVLRPNVNVDVFHQPSSYATSISW